jgi:uncharacterized membrane protein
MGDWGWIQWVAYILVFAWALGVAALVVVFGIYILAFLDAGTTWFEQHSEDTEGGGDE